MRHVTRFVARVQNELRERNVRFVHNPTKSVAQHVSVYANMLGRKWIGVVRVV